MENQEQDCADVHRRRRGGDDRPVVRCGAALQALLSGGGHNSLFQVFCIFRLQV